MLTKIFKRCCDWCVWTVLVTLPELAFAADATHGGEHVVAHGSHDVAGAHAHVSVGSQLFWPIANFSVFMVLILFYLYPKFGRPAVRARSIQIRQQLEKAADVLASADKELGKSKQRLAGIESEHRAILAELEREGRNAAQAILEQARATATRIEGDTKNQIESEYENARREIRADVVRAAAGRVRQKLEQGLGENDERRLRKEALNRLFQ